MEGRGEVGGVEGRREVPQDWHLGGEVCTIALLQRRGTSPFLAGH